MTGDNDHHRLGERRAVHDAQDWQSRPARERLDAAARLSRAAYALGPCVRLRKAITRLQRDAAGNEP
jgi:hypothetical protein